MKKGCHATVFSAGIRSAPICLIDLNTEFANESSFTPPIAYRISSKLHLESQFILRNGHIWSDQSWADTWARSEPLRQLSLHRSRSTPLPQPNRHVGLIPRGGYRFHSRWFQVDAGGKIGGRGCFTIAFVALTVPLVCVTPMGLINGIGPGSPPPLGSFKGVRSRILICSFLVLVAILISLSVC